MNMKALTVIIILLVTGCRVDKKLHAELFDKCLVRAAEARKGVNYTTNDDEDYDEVIKACFRATQEIARGNG